MSRQDVSDETIERFRQLPVATIYGGGGGRSATSPASWRASDRSRRGESS